MQLIEAANCVCVNDVYVSHILECMVGYKENMACSISEITIFNNFFAEPQLS